MKTSCAFFRMKPLALSLLFSLFASFSHAGNYVVLPSNAQSVIDAASSGDIIRFLPGNYGDLTVVNKDLSFTNAGQTPATIGNLEANGTVLNLIRFQAATITANDLPGKPSNLIVTQGTYGRITSNAAKSRISYCTLNFLVLSGKAIVTGCEFKGDVTLFPEVSVGGGIGIDVHGANTHAAIHNNHVHNYKLNDVFPITEQCIGIRVRDGADAEIRNNVIHACKDTSHTGTETDCGMGVFVKAGSHAVVIGNVIYDCFVDQGGTRGDRLVYAPIDSVVRHNVLYKSGNVDAALVGGGVISVNNTDQDPKFIGGSPYDYHLQADSPAKNAGPPDAQYNDRDGTRNDVGMYGGHSFIPNGRTTKKPIVLTIETTPFAVPAGGIITIESTGAVPK